MKKFLKVFSIILVIIIGLFVVYITEESIRLNKVKEDKPLIIFDQTKCSPSCAEIGKEIVIDYYSFGYKISIKYYHLPESTQNNDVYKITGKEFKLFYKFLLWSWVE